MIYFYFTCIIFFLRYFLNGNSQNLYRFYYVIFFTIFIFVTFRYQVGCDWEGYRYMFNKVSKYNFSQVMKSFDPLSHLIFYLISKFGLPYHFVYIPFSVIFFWGAHILARRQPDPFGFLILLFPILIINLTMSGIRQAAAIGIICIAFSSFIDRKIINFIFWVILASAIHSSALIFILLIPFIIWKLNIKTFVYAIIFSIPILIYLLSLDSARYAIIAYVGTHREAYGAIFRTAILAITAIYTLLFVRKKWINAYPGDYNIIILGSIGMISAFIMTFIASIVGDRFGYYFIPIQAIIFARLPYLKFRRYNTLHSAAPYFGLLIVLFFWTHTSWIFKQCYLPYKNWIF